MASPLDNVLKWLGYTPVQPAQPVQKSDTVEKSDNTHREAIAQNPLTMAYASMNTQWGLRKPSKITFQTLRRMAAANWVDRACIETLRDEVTALPWDITPVNDKEPYDIKFQQFVKELLLRPNRNNENWRTLIQKVVEDILVCDAGTIEKVRNSNGVVIELWHVDGATIKPCYDDHGVVGDPAYQQFIPGQKENLPKAEWNNKDLIYIMWNPQGSVDTFGFGLSPVEAGLAVGTAFLYAEAYTLGFFKTNTIPPMIINMGKEVPPQEIDKFRAFLAAEMMGNQGFHTPVIASFNEGFDVKNLMVQPKDMAWKDYLEWQMKWKVALYRMSPQDIGFNLDQYKVEGEVQQELSQNKAINSLKGVLKQYIDAEIIGDKGFKNFNYNLQFQWIDTDVVDPLDQAQVDKIYLQAGVKSINEVRQRDGLDPIEGGQKPLIVSGTTVMQLDPTPMMSDEGDALNPVGKSLIEKTYIATEGEIVSMQENATAVCWMDDRGVTQPLFVTDMQKKQGFQVKPAFLDEKREQEPPEAEVARLLRAMKVNTPDVQIMTYEQVLALFPQELYPSFTNWIDLKPPFDSQEWRRRWGNTRKSNYFIVTGFLSGTDLGDHELQKMMATQPASYVNAVQDLARVWVAERVFYLGDRKPGHYIITQQGNGYGVDYQFYKTKLSYEKTKYFLPKTLGLINSDLMEIFDNAVQVTVNELGHEKLFTQKTFRPHLPKDWERMKGYEDVEKKMGTRIQKGIWDWYKKATNVKARKQMIMRKAADPDNADVPDDFEFDPNASYITNGSYVFQGGKKFPASVLPASQLPSSSDVKINAGDYQEGFDYGASQALVVITPNIPAGITVRNAELYAPAFNKRANLITDTITNTMKNTIDDIIVRGINSGATYGDIADQIQQNLGLDENGDPLIPGWRAEMIARTEAQWAISEGMRQQYEDAGIMQVNISPAMTACDECVAVADGNPYDVNEVEGILPVHPNCRCVLVGDYSDFLKADRVEWEDEGAWVTINMSRPIYIANDEIRKDGWVTINGNHVYIGGEEGKAGAARRVASTVGSATVKEGGATMDVTGFQPKEGFALSPYKGAETKIAIEDFKADPTGHTQKFMAEHQELLNKVDHFVGSWYNKEDGHVYLDVSVVKKDAGDAVRVARSSNQLAIFNLSNFTEIPASEYGKYAKTITQEEDFLKSQNGSEEDGPGYYGSTSPQRDQEKVKKKFKSTKLGLQKSLLRLESILPLLQKADSDGNWVTLQSGQHVLIGGSNVKVGKVTKMNGETTPAIQNPTMEVANKLAYDNGDPLRGFLTKEGDLVVWNPYEAMHSEAADSFPHLKSAVAVETWADGTVSLTDFNNNFKGGINGAARTIALNPHMQARLSSVFDPGSEVHLDEYDSDVVGNKAQQIYERTINAQKTLDKALGIIDKIKSFQKGWITTKEGNHILLDEDGKAVYGHSGNSHAGGVKRDEAKSGEIQVGAQKFTLTPEEQRRAEKYKLRTDVTDNPNILGRTHNFGDAESPLIEMNTKRILSTGADPNITFYHEFGHFIDHTTSADSGSNDSEFQSILKSETNALVANRLTRASTGRIASFPRSDLETLIKGGTIKNPDTGLPLAFKNKAYMAYVKSPVELFADSYGQFRTAPEALKATAPLMYNYMSKVAK